MRRSLKLLGTVLTSTLLVGLCPGLSQEVKTQTEESAAEKVVAASGDGRQGYLYIEPYQIRFEVLFDIPLALRWLGMEGLRYAALDEAAKARITQRARLLVADWCEIQVGTHEVRGRLVDTLIVKGRPGATMPLIDGESLSPDEAMLGFMWEFSTPPAPEGITLRWKGFVPGAEDLPVRVHFGPKTENLFLTKALPTGHWSNGGRLARPAPLAEVPTFTTTPTTHFPLGLILSLLAGLGFYAWIKIKHYRLPGGSTAYFFVWLLGTAVMSQMLVLPLGGKSQPPEITSIEEAEAILKPLLRNTYRAFDHREESQVYDVLARSVEGELLRDLYLETIHALTLDGREGTRTQVTDFDARVESVLPDSDGAGFVAECEWTALGKISHWGHPHTRVNRYSAKVTIRPADGEWKISAIDVTEARRI